MPMRVDEPRHQGFALRIHRHARRRARNACAEQPHDFAVVADQKAGEMLHLACSIDLDSIRIGDERIRERRRGEQGRGERRQNAWFHGRSLSIVWGAVKG